MYSPPNGGYNAGGGPHVHSFRHPVQSGGPMHGAHMDPSTNFMPFVPSFHNNGGMMAPNYDQQMGYGPAYPSNAPAYPKDVDSRAPPKEPKKELSITAKPYVPSFPSDVNPRAPQLDTQMERNIDAKPFVPSFARSVPYHPQMERNMPAMPPYGRPYMPPYPNNANSRAPPPHDSRLEQSIDAKPFVPSFVREAPQNGPQMQRNMATKPHGPPYNNGVNGAPPHVPSKASAPTSHTSTKPPPTTTCEPSPSNPLVVLLYGNRGAGKSTQAKLLATKYNLLELSSGTMFMANKQPYIELERVLQQHFGPNKEEGGPTYNGVVLDRFIVNSEIDAYYVQHALDCVHLPVPMVFWLKLNPDVGLARAQQRDNDAGTVKGTNSFWRIVEQRAQTTVTEKVYEPAGCATIIECEDQTAEAVSAQIEAVLHRNFAQDGRPPVQLPTIHPVGHPLSLPLALNTDYATFHDIVKAVHACIGNHSGRVDTSPLTTIGSYLDRGFFRMMDRVKSSMYATPKADGQRFLVVKHRQRGFMGIPMAFNCAFDFSPLFHNPDWYTDTAQAWSSSPTSELEVMLDCELLAPNATEAPQLFIIDFLYFYGNVANATKFQRRYEHLQKWIARRDELAKGDVAAGMVGVKTYVPINALGELLPTLEDASFPIDGIIFQHSGLYRFGKDTALYKWKPREMCTADFRLTGGVQDAATQSWSFSLNVSDCVNGVWGEVAYAGATATFSKDEVLTNQLHDNSIVELSLDHVDLNAKNTLWKFHRERSDKSSPNRMNIVEAIVKLHHMTYAELVEKCSKVKFVAS